MTNETENRLSCDRNRDDFVVPTKKFLWDQASTWKSASWKPSPGRPRGLRRCTWGAEVDSGSHLDLWTRASRRTRPGLQSRPVAFSGQEVGCSNTKADSVLVRFRFCPESLCCCVTVRRHRFASTKIPERLRSWDALRLAGVEGGDRFSGLDFSGFETTQPGRCSDVRESPVEEKVKFYVEF